MKRQKMGEETLGVRKVGASKGLPLVLPLGATQVPVDVPKVHQGVAYRVVSQKEEAFQECHVLPLKRDPPLGRPVEVHLKPPLGQKMQVQIQAIYKKK